MGPAGAGSPLPEAGSDTVVFELDRFEWKTHDRIELTGVWSGVRGRRFIRPTLVVRLEGGETRRLLAMLEHKPWPADDGVEWVAAFAWDGEPTRCEGADLNVASGIDLALPPPRQTPRKSPRRFKKPIKSKSPAPDGPNELLAGLVSDPPASPEVADGAPAAAEPARDLLGELEASIAEAARIRGERDQALEQVKTLRGELEAARHATERAVGDARAAERGEATRMLGEGAELRAAVERQRELAYEARDHALQQRERAIEQRTAADKARDDALDQRKQAIAERKEADRARDRAEKERDRALKERQQALLAQEKAFQDRDRAYDARDAALRERDTVMQLHERGLPLREPKPRFTPHVEQRSSADVWSARAVALGLLSLAFFVVLKLFAG